MKTALLFSLLMIYIPSTFAAFKETNQRYISGYDFQNRMSYFFNEAYLSLSPSANANSTITTCFANTMAFGANNPSTGNPTNTSPNSDTIKVLSSCVNASVLQLQQYLALGTTDYTQTQLILSRIMPENLLKIKLNESNAKNFMSTPGLLTPEELKTLIQFLVQEFLGTEGNILSYGLITDLAKYHDYLFTKVNTGSTLSTIYMTLMNELVMRDEFLTY